MNESFKTDPSLATSARAAKESGSYLCASNVTPTTVRFIVFVFLCLLCSCRMSSTQMTCSHFRKNRPKKRQKPAGCRSRIISKNRPVPIFGRSTGASLFFIFYIFLSKIAYQLNTYYICVYSPVLWTFTQRSVISQVVTAFDHWIYKNHFRFKRGFNIASTTEHIHFYLNYYSVGYLTMYY